MSKEADKELAEILAERKMAQASLDLSYFLEALFKKHKLKPTQMLRIVQREATALINTILLREERREKREYQDRVGAERKRAKG